MKRLIALLLTITILFALASCKKESNAKQTSEKETETLQSATEEELLSKSETLQESSTTIKDTPSTTTVPPTTTTIPTTQKTEASSSVTTSKAPKVNDSTNIVFANESVNILVKGIGLVPIREAYEKGYIRIKIINGLAYSVSTMNGVDYIGEADEETGISYDGESPIIYTYTDGTTGTERRDGATYEYLPGMYRTVYLAKDGTGRIIGSICSSCGKEVNFNNHPNSCYQSNKSCYCRHCGVYVIAYTCHTCATQSGNINYCPNCGKKAGQGGADGTCVRFIRDTNCPNCGEHVKAFACHTCKN